MIRQRKLTTEQYNRRLAKIPVTTSPHLKVRVELMTGGIEYWEPERRQQHSQHTLERYPLARTIDITEEADRRWLDKLEIGHRVVQGKE